MPRATGPAKLKPFPFFGVDIDPRDGNKTALGTCPFCDKEEDFFVNQSTGQWDCKSCFMSGNIPVFFKELWEASVKNTDDKDFAELQKDRGVPADAFRFAGFAKSMLTGDWLLPMWNLEGKLSNLCKVVKIKGKWKALPAPGCKMHPFGMNNYDPSKPSIKWLEGPWDMVAMIAALKSVKKTPRGMVKTTNEASSMFATHNVLAAPGSSTFPEEWLATIEGKDAGFIYDNDHAKKTKQGRTVKAGWDGMQKVVDMVEKNGHAPKTFNRIRWGKAGYDPDRESGFDFRDLYLEEGPTKALATINRLSEKVTVKKVVTAHDEEVTTVEPLPRTSFKQLEKDFHDNLHFTQQMRDTLVIMLAVNLSTPIAGDQLFFRVIGPPGSGKTTLAECMSVAKEYVIARSVMTGFHSGYNQDGKKEDASLIPKMNGKTFVVKDADTLINNPRRDTILAELRDIFDGTSRAEYRNREQKIYEDLRTTFILCGTDALRSINRTYLGERFLDCEILGEEDQEPYLDRAVDNAWDGFVNSLKAGKKNQEDGEGDSEVHDPEKANILHRATLGFMQYLHEGLYDFPVPTIDATTKAKLKAYGKVLSYMRCKIKKEKDGMEFRPRPELATRLGGQFTRLAGTIALVLGKKKVDRECTRLVKKVVLDTAQGFQFEVTQLLAHHPSGLSNGQIANELHLAMSTVQRVTGDLLQLKAVQKRQEANKSGIAGRHVHLWTLTPALRDIWTKAMK